MQFALRERKRVDNTRMTASGKQHQPLRRIEHERLIFGNCVLDKTRRGKNFSADAPDTLGIRTGHWSCQPRARKNLRSLLVLDEYAARRFIVFPDRDHL